MGPCRLCGKEDVRRAIYTRVTVGPRKQRLFRLCWLCPTCIVRLAEGAQAAEAAAVRIRRETETATY